MTVIECMLDRFHDGVYSAAMARDRDGLEEAKQNFDDLDSFLPPMDLYGRTKEEAAADALHSELEGVVIRHFVRQYPRADMLTLLNLLLRVDKADRISVQLCEGLTLTLSELCRHWNQQHPVDRPIEYVSTLYDMP